MRRSRLVPEACFLIVVLMVAGCGGEPEVPEPEQEPVTEVAEVEEVVEAEQDELQPLSSRRITLYFPSSSASRLVKESREIFQTASPGDQAKQILSDILEGPNGRNALPAVPTGVRLRQVYVTDGGVAFADFSSDLMFAVRGGSTDEILAVYSIVNSLVLNVSEIKKVAILVEGEECETLSGHMDLRRPLPANHRLLR